MVNSPYDNLTVVCAHQPHLCKATFGGLIYIVPGSYPTAQVLFLHHLISSDLVDWKMIGLQSGWLLHFLEFIKDSSFILRLVNGQKQPLLDWGFTIGPSVRPLCRRRVRLLLERQVSVCILLKFYFECHSMIFYGNAIGPSSQWLYQAPWAKKGETKVQGIDPSSAPNADVWPQKGTSKQRLVKSENDTVTLEGAL